MKPIGFNKDECIRNLKSYKDEIQEIINLIGGRISLPRADKEKAQDMLKSLKQCLKTDYDRRSTVRGRSAMSDAESAYFFPAIHEAITKINIKTNSNPGEKWTSELIDAEEDIDFYLDQLIKD